jgi:hypothetical protein
MVLNRWYDRTRGRPVDCTDDPGAAPVAHGGTARGAGDSARNLLAPTLGDQMKARLSPAPRVVVLSMKARSAIDLAGHTPDAAIWFDGRTWVSSNAFTRQPLPWVEKFLAAHPIVASAATPWTPLMPATAYRDADDAGGEKPPAGWTRTFPHPLVGQGIHGLERWATSPAADAYLAEMADAALAELKLGQGASTDFLAVSFSGNDYVGHSYGPRSHELQDELARLDVTVGKLLAALDRRVGRGRYVLALTSDHGVSRIPEQVQAEGKDGGRVLYPDMRKRVEAIIGAELGPGGSYLADLEENDIYLRPGVHQQLAARPGAVGRVLAGLRAMPGVAEAFESSELRDPAQAKDPVRHALALGFHPERRGDLVMVRKPNWIWGELATNHGTLHDYDQQVPVVFYGKPFKAGRHEVPASPADVVPTLGALVGVDMPRAEGRVVTEVLSRPLADPTTHRVTAATRR